MNEHGRAVTGESDGFACEVGGFGPAVESSGQHPEGNEQVGPAVHTRREGDCEGHQRIYRDEGEEGPDAECAAGGRGFVDDQAGAGSPVEFGESPDQHDSCEEDSAGEPPVSDDHAGPQYSSKDGHDGY